MDKEMRGEESETLSGRKVAMAIASCDCEATSLHYTCQETYRLPYTRRASERERSEGGHRRTMVERHRQTCKDCSILTVRSVARVLTSPAGHGFPSLSPSVLQVRTVR
ncbi:hypothetical protein SAY87_008327 [Trapa incisa]|uniref:Uncharacterized protein n=1 Tax=Trapa incisa TaxID=236973 RepID=A0AAN7QJB2_9MYRT|nr:hypothetical protein SAY87_008327 [Trapa incisa]